MNLTDSVSTVGGTPWANRLCPGKSPWTSMKWSHWPIEPEDDRSSKPVPWSKIESSVCQCICSFAHVLHKLVCSQQSWGANKVHRTRNACRKGIVLVAKFLRLLKLEFNCCQIDTNNGTGFSGMYFQYHVPEESHVQCFCSWGWGGRLSFKREGRGGLQVQKLSLS